MPIRPRETKFWLGGWIYEQTPFISTRSRIYGGVGGVERALWKGCSKKYYGILKPGTGPYRGCACLLSCQMRLNASERMLQATQGRSCCRPLRLITELVYAATCATTRLCLFFSNTNLRFCGSASLKIKSIFHSIVVVRAMVALREISFLIFASHGIDIV